MVTGIDTDTREWVATTPGVRKLLRKVRESGTPLDEILPVLEKAVARKKSSAKRGTKSARKRRATSKKKRSER